MEYPRFQLRRVTSDGNWIPEIDALRFIAIISVVIFHMTGELLARSGHTVAVQPRYWFPLRMIEHGDRGVQVFYVISGFILCRPFFRQHVQHGKPVSLKYYYLRRITRLEPPYVISLLVCAAAIWLYRRTPVIEMAPHFLASMFYVHNFVYQKMSTISFVAWTLEIEAQFYILAPFLAKVFLISSHKVRVTLLLVILAVSRLVPVEYHGFPIGVTILYYIGYFLAGFLFADLLESGVYFQQKHWGWDIVSMGLWPVVFLIPRSAADHFMPFLLIPLFIAAFRGPVTNKFFRIRWIALIGGMCYSIYLLHELIIQVGFKITKQLIVFNDFLANWAMQLATLGIAVLVIGGIFYVLVERPFMDPRWPRRLARLVGRATAKEAEAGAAI